MIDNAIVSIIVPVYNSEKYLEKCICSIANQNYSNLQIILINDGSIDQSEEICRRWCTLDPRIELVNQKNKGVSAARNVGLTKVSGEYVCFVDADDYLPVDSISHRVRCFNENVGLCVTSFFKEDESNKRVVNMIEKNVPTSEYLRMLFDIGIMGYQGYLWNKIFSADVIKDNNLSFDENIQYNEDRLFIYMYLKYISTIKICDRATYVYRENMDSAMGRVMKGVYKDDMFSELLAFDEMINEEKDVEIYNMIIEEAFYSAHKMRKMLTKGQKPWYYISSKMIHYMKIYNNYSFTGIRKKMRMIKKYCVND